jgi:hypothetical protein
MDIKIKNALKRAGNKIALKENSCICAAIDYCSKYGAFGWKQTDEAEMINPGVLLYWWGPETMKQSFRSDKCRGARLIGIAMMVTMPKEIVEGKCCP